MRLFRFDRNVSCSIFGFVAATTCNFRNHDGAATWRRIMSAVTQLANNTPSGQVH
jgi:hypothetical protein